MPDYFRVRPVSMTMQDYLAFLVSSTEKLPLPYRIPASSEADARVKFEPEWKP
jgi:hypothetical protein